MIAQIEKPVLTPFRLAVLITMVAVSAGVAVPYGGPDYGPQGPGPAPGYYYGGAVNPYPWYTGVDIDIGRGYGHGWRGGGGGWRRR